MVQDKTTSIIAAGVVGTLGLVIRLLQSGEFLPWYTRLLGIGAPDYPFSGKAEKEFTELEKTFRKHFRQGREVGASVAVYSKGQCTVELYGGYADYHKSIPFTKDTLQVVFSSSKFIESVALARLVEQGLLKYEDRISDIWPEFQNGKEEVTIAQLMRHEAGLTYFTEPLLKPEDFRDPDIVGEKLASQKHLWDSKPIRSYHAVTRGLILNEIVRRVDPKKRGLNQIYREEFNSALGTEFQLGLDDTQLNRKSSWYHYPSVDLLFLGTLPPKLLGFKEIKGFDPSGMKKGSPFYHIMEQKLTHEKDWVNSLEYTQLELSSSNGFSNAKSLARIAAVFSSPNESSFLSLDSRASALQDPIEEFDTCLNKKTILTQAGIGVFTFSELGPTKFYGWPGLGGSVVLFNLDYDFAFSYVMNAQHVTIGVDGRSRALLIAAFKSHLEFIKSE